MRTSPIGLLVLALPLIEIALFVVVGSRIGVLATLGLVFLAALAGITLMQRQGMDAMARIRTQMDQGKTPARDLVHAVMIMTAGFLLLIPGFLTDAIGIALFIPAVREMVFKRFSVQIVTAAPFGSRRQDPGTITLEADQYHRDPD